MTELNLEGVQNKLRLDPHEIAFLEDGIGYTFSDKAILEEAL